jgi:Tol biopolymer transport system component
MSPDGSGQRLLARGDSFEWSPDGNWIAYERDDGLYVIRRDGTGRRRIVRASLADPTWSPDGKQIAFRTFADGGGLGVTDVARGGVRPLTRNGEDDNPVWSPDGRRISFMRWMGYGFSIGTVRPDGSDVRLLTPDWLDAQEQTWSPDGRQILVEGVGGDRDLYLMEATEGAVPRNLTQTESQNEQSARWSPNGRWIAFFSSNSRRFNPDIHTMRADGTRHRNLTRSPRSVDVDVAWSPDGRSLVFSGVEKGTGKRDIYVMSSSGRSVTNLTSDPIGTRNGNPSWSS